MVTIAQMQRGVADFIDKEVVPHLSPFERIVVGGGAGLIAAKMPEVMESLNKHPVVAALHLYDKESRMVDIDSVYAAVEPYIGSEPFSVKIPVAGVTLKMGQREIRELYTCIKEA